MLSTCPHCTGPTYPTEYGATRCLSCSWLTLLKEKRMEYNEQDVAIPGMVLIGWMGGAPLYARTEDEATRIRACIVDEDQLTLPAGVPHPLFGIED